MTHQIQLSFISSVCVYIGYGFLIFFGWLAEFLDNLPFFGSQEGKTTKQKLRPVRST